MRRELRRTLIEYQSLRVNGSTVFFLRPFLPLESLLFLQTINIDKAQRSTIVQLTFQQP